MEPTEMNKAWRKGLTFSAHPVVFTLIMTVFFGSIGILLRWWS
jgi:hypothetical protein